MFPSSAADVECPVCGISVNSSVINKHVDSCLHTNETVDDTSSKNDQPKLLKKTNLEGSSTEIHPPVAKKPRMEAKSESMANKWQTIFRQPQSKNQTSPKRELLKSSESRQRQQQSSGVRDSESRETSNDNIEVCERSLPKTKNEMETRISDRKLQQSKSKSQIQPLAEIMRPAKFKEYVGQIKAIGENSVLRTLLETHQVPSCILWGPPGCGKTSLANVIACRAKESGNSRFVKLSATSSNLNEVKNAITAAKNEQKMFKKRTILFIDEIHRFNKLQQDAFLPHVENGTITLIGATTENPSFRVNSALLSRCRVIVLEKLSIQHLEEILERGAKEMEITVLKDEDLLPPNSRKKCITQQALRAIGLYCDGDARTALNTLQLIAQANESETSRVKGYRSTVIDMENVKDVLQRSHVTYDRTGDEHYNCISALIKSMRGSDANASLYWLGRMMLGGEDPLFVARRLIVFASEDVGLADSQALPLAVSTYTACHYNGMPECQINLSHCVVYLARAPKSTESYMAYNRVKEHIQNYKGGLPGVPLHLRNASTKLMKDLGYAKGYNRQTGHGEQSYLPEEIAGIDFFKGKRR